MVGEHEEEGLGRISSSQEIDAIGGDPACWMEHFVIWPRAGGIPIASYTGIVVITVGSPEFFSEPRRVVVGHAKLSMLSPGSMHVAVVKHNVVKAKKISPWIHVHLANTLCVISRISQGSSKCDRVFPWFTTV